MVFDSQEIMDHGGLFGVDREEWEKSPQFHEKVMERQEHQQEREQAFLAQNRDCFAIYQVSRDDPQNVRFMNLDWLKSLDISIDRSNYDLIYTAPLSESSTCLLYTSTGRWEESAGCRAEYIAARVKGLPISLSTVTICNAYKRR